jgi:hypothetical protein
VSFSGPNSAYTNIVLKYTNTTRTLSYPGQSLRAKKEDQKAK